MAFEKVFHVWEVPRHYFFIMIIVTGRVIADAKYREAVCVYGEGLLEASYVCYWDVFDSLLFYFRLG